MSSGKVTGKWEYKERASERSDDYLGRKGTFRYKGTEQRRYESGGRGKGKARRGRTWV
jgi:hypothetical protein